ncbi:hypothetical protein ANRL1_00226 [Anaerolineae bacterium]|nr:hypothetical protein ANRL1_00226 [Anaerolineae bacterium]
MLVASFPVPSGVYAEAKNKIPHSVTLPDAMREIMQHGLDHLVEKVLPTYTAEQHASATPLMYSGGYRFGARCVMGFHKPSEKNALMRRLKVVKSAFNLKIGYKRRGIKAVHYFHICTLCLREFAAGSFIVKF